MLLEFWNLVFIQPLANALLLFYKLFGDLGIATIALTIVIKLLLVPIAIPSLRSMQKMKELAPELAKLKKKYKGDKTRSTQAQADFYKSRGVNPAAGCLPQLVQFVVLIALLGVFRIFATPDVTGEINHFAYPALKLTEQVRTHFIYVDLTKPDVFHFPNIPFPVPGPLLVIAAVAQLLSSKMMIPVVEKEKQLAEKTKGEMDDIMASTQQQMLYFFPVLTIIFGFTFASGLVLYWMMSAVTQMVQQYFVTGWGGLSPWLKALRLVK